MNTYRFWTGNALASCVALGAILAVSPGRDPQFGRVEGTVTYRGRPLKNGTVFFVSEDHRRSEDRHAFIDDKGHFECDPYWRRDREAPTRFRICVVLHDCPSASEASADAGAVSRPGLESEEPAVPRGEEATPTARVLRASTGAPRTDAAPGTSPKRRSPRFSDPRTTDIQVRLGAEPANLHIELKD